MTYDKKKSISVISTVLNEISNIEQLIKSILIQSLYPDEVIIIDGGSSDGTWEYLNKHLDIYKNFIIIQDVTCSLKYSKSPIAKGRNTAIKKASYDIIVCMDAGCSYPENWIYEITKPIFSEGADLSSGGSCIKPGTESSWDVASSPFLGFDLYGVHMPKTETGTARSLAFKKSVWEKVQGFPEYTFASEDTEYIKKIKALKFNLVFSKAAPAYYSPNYSLKGAIYRLSRYAYFDGARNLTPKRYIIMTIRSVNLIIASMLISWSLYPILLTIVIEMIFSLKHDLRGFIFDGYFNKICHRMLFSIITPFVFSASYTNGIINKRKYEIIT